MEKNIFFNKDLYMCFGKDILAITYISFGNPKLFVKNERKSQNFRYFGSIFDVI